MTQRQCLQLMIVGLITGLTPACFQPALQRPGAANPREVVATAEPVPALRSPYSQARESPPTQARDTQNVAAAKVTPVELDSLPQRPKTLLPETKMPQLAEVDPPAKNDTAMRIRKAEKPSSAALVKATYSEEEKPQLFPISVGRDEPPLLKAMRCYMEKRPDKALPFLSPFEAENQDVLLNLLPLTVSMSEVSLKQANPQEVAVVVEQLQSLLLLLRPHAALIMEKLCFCREIRKFGAYEAMEPQPKFRPGELVEVYFEIRNVTCNHVASARGEFQTHTNTKLEIREQRGAFIMNKPFVNQPEYFHTMRHDYFDRYRFQVPPTAPPGRYDLTVEVTDVPTGRKVKQKLEFQVRSN